MTDDKGAKAQAKVNIKVVPSGSAVHELSALLRAKKQDGGDLKTVSVVVSLGDIVEFDATGSKGSIKAYSLDFGDDKSAILGTDAITTHAYAKDGLYTATLKVSSDSGSSEDDISILVSDQPRTAKSFCEEYKRTGKLPSKFDWHFLDGKNYMTEVKDQLGCGSCWAFGLTSTLEGAYKVYKDDPSLNVDLSEQQLISCVGRGTGCDGTWPESAINYVKQTGVTTEDCFHYTGIDASDQTDGHGKLISVLCDSNLKCSAWQSKSVKVKDFVKIVGEDIPKIKADLICNGPLYLGIPNSFLPHAVSISGYDDDSSLCKDYYPDSGCWIFKNSWGTSIKDDVIPHVDGYGLMPYSMTNSIQDLYYVTF